MSGVLAIQGIRRIKVGSNSIGLLRVLRMRYVAAVNSQMHSGADRGDKESSESARGDD